MEIHTFPQKVREQLKFYVYMYIDPRTDKPFYIGKGIGNRIFSHLRVGNETEKTMVLKELGQLNLRPVLEVLRYGLSEKEALLVETTAIDLCGLNHLTNAVHGHHANLNGRTKVSDLIHILSCAKAKIKEPVVLITINKAYRFGMSPQELYDVTRSAWIVNPKRCKKPEYAMAIFRGIIREVYTIAEWVRGGSTMRFSDKDGWHDNIPGRWEFVGKVAEARIQKKYVGKSVDHVPGAQNPIQYLNC